MAAYIPSHSGTGQSSSMSSSCAPSYVADAGARAGSCAGGNRCHSRARLSSDTNHSLGGDQMLVGRKKLLHRTLLSASTTVCQCSTEMD